MYLRKFTSISLNLITRPRTFIEWIIFTLIMLIALFFSSYTSSELKPFTLLGSLDTRHEKRNNLTIF